MTESRHSSPKPAATRAAKPAKVAPAKPAANVVAPVPKALAVVPPSAPSYRHPNLGLAPVDMTAGYAAAAEKLRSDQMRISATALESAVKLDPTMPARYDETGLRRLLRDSELLVERLAMCLASDNDRWLSEYAEWIAPIYRRRRVPLNDLSALCAGIGRTVEPMLSPDEFAAATRSLEAATAVFKQTSRIGGDRHKRNALWKWMYRGV